MGLPDYIKILGLDEAELARRRSFFEITDEDLSRLASLKGFASKHTGDIVEGFYELLLSHPETRGFFPDEAVVRRVKRTQAQYFLGLFQGVCDLRYVEDRLRVGVVHERIGLTPKWYLGAYSRYLHLVNDRLIKELSREEADKAFASIRKIVFFDMALAIDAYIAAGKEAIERHRAAIRELSTPVIQVHSRILLLPLIGTLDSQRAQQVMEAVLLRVVQEQARVIILDIAGVPVVDTKVADHLLKTTAAVRLLGAKTILTGLTAEVARTIVQLGVDISAMETQARLADGLELALEMVGKQITARPA
jgi:rsbT co-antagonist protein RsbR